MAQIPEKPFLDEPFSPEEPPEVCPQCGAPNLDDEGDWISEEHPGFCSNECAKKNDTYYRHNLREAAKILGIDVEEVYDRIRG